MSYLDMAQLMCSLYKKYAYQIVYKLLRYIKKLFKTVYTRPQS